MKLGLVTLLILGAILVGSEACWTKCELKTVYNYPQCCPNRLHKLSVWVCIKFGCGKRSMGPEIEAGFPCNFTKYDVNKDGVISKEEFLKTMNMKSLQADMEKTLKQADKNYDGNLSCDEFKEAPIEFQCEPIGCQVQTSQDEPFDLE